MRRSDPRRNTRKKGRVLLWLSAANLGLLLLLYLVEARMAERHWLGTFVSYAPQHLLGLPATAFAVWALVSKRWRSLLINLISLVFFFFALMGLCVPWRSAIHGGSGVAKPITVKVMTYNIHHSQAGGPLVAREVANAKPDIVLLQEANSLPGYREGAGQITRGGRWPYMIDYGELVILSRYPIITYQIYQMEKNTGRALLYAVLDVSGRQVGVVNVHFNSSLRPKWLPKDEAADISERIDRASDVRFQQLAALLNVTARLKIPTIVAGDFNTPPRGIIYEAITQRLNDSFGRAGWGLGYSFPSGFPVMRIDYVFTGGGAMASSCSVVSSQASDHRPVVAQVDIPR